MSHHHDHQHEGHDCDHAQSAAPEHEHAMEECGHDHTHGPGCAHDHKHAHHHEPEDNTAWTRRYFLFLQMLVLLMIGGVMCYFVASGRIDGRNPDAPYVTGWFKVLVLAGGLGIIVMGLFNFFMRNKDEGCGHDHGDGDDCNGGEHAPSVHSHDGSVAGRAITLLLLSGSIAAAAILTPDQFSARYMLHKGQAYDTDRNSPGAQQKAQNPVPAAAVAPGGLTLEKMEEFQPRNKDGNFELGVVQLYYTGSDPEYARVMDGQPVETVGQVVKDEVNPGPGHLRVFTLQVTCCAADARPYSVPVVFENGPPEYTEMSWYKITGHLEMTQERGMKVARIKASSLTPSLRPADQRTIF